MMMALPLSYEKTRIEDYAIDVIEVKMLDEYAEKWVLVVVEFEGVIEVVVVLDAESRLLNLQLNNRDWMKQNHSEWDVV